MCVCIVICAHIHYMSTHNMCTYTLYVSTQYVRMCATYQQHVHIHSTCQHIICTHLRDTSTHNHHACTLYVDTQYVHMYAACLHTSCTHVCYVSTKNVCACMLYANTQYVNMHTMCQHDIGTYVVYMRIHSTAHIYSTQVYAVHIYTFIYCIPYMFKCTWHVSAVTHMCVCDHVDLYMHHM